jgi:predicted porin
MQKKLLAVAVAGALAAPAVAFAQSAVTISGALNLWYESAGATGATNSATGATGTASTYDVKTRDRIQDGNGSNIRFTATEDLGGGIAGFGQVESAVLGNAQTRVDAVGTPGQTLASNQSQNANGWGTRNSGVGLRGAAWGEILMGIWDTHYTELYPVDSQNVKGASQSSSLALLNSFGTPGIAGVSNTGGGTNALGGATIGARYSNTIRYQSPSWAGFNFRASMARPTDGAVPTTAGSVTEGKKNRAWNIVPTYSNGPVYVSWSYLKDKDIIAGQAATYANATVGGTVGSGAVGALANTNLYTITSNRLHGAYTFPFGLKLGLVVDASKLAIQSSAGVGASEIKKTTWAVPISWTSGPHTVFGTFARASKLKGSLGGAGGTTTDLSSVMVTPAGAGATPMSVGDNSSAKFYSLGYQFDLSKRTTIHANYALIKNDALIGYDFFSNGVTMNANNFGADPRIISLGVRHAF